jgi:hypothetical protein
VFLCVHATLSSPHRLIFRVPETRPQTVSVCIDTVLCARANSAVPVADQLRSAARRSCYSLSRNRRFLVNNFTFSQCSDAQSSMEVAVVMRDSRSFFPKRSIFGDEECFR